MEGGRTLALPQVKASVALTSGALPKRSKGLFLRLYPPAERVTRGAQHSETARLLSLRKRPAHRWNSVLAPIAASGADQRSELLMPRAARRQWQHEPALQKRIGAVPGGVADPVPASGELTVSEGAIARLRRPPKLGEPHPLTTSVQEALVRAQAATVMHGRSRARCWEPPACG